MSGNKAFNLLKSYQNSSDQLIPNFNVSCDFLIKPKPLILLIIDRAKTCERFWKKLTSRFKRTIKRRCNIKRLTTRLTSRWSAIGMRCYRETSDAPSLIFTIDCWDWRRSDGTWDQRWALMSRKLWPSPRSNGSTTTRSCCQATWCHSPVESTWWATWSHQSHCSSK